MSDVAITNIETLLFIISGYAAMCCIAMWQYQLRHFIRFPHNVAYLTTLHTVLSIGIVMAN